ncbi:4'-phosphopantetheinyl transferase superfamily protein [Streptomyces sp. NPDC056149]|uniref:4'-phosphopantetheinyl transferase superfamily protein n=1 Tax=unclassified Streptomyces TaxID=2593676 RepID=UPI002381110B|nr:4'-phosphopantetheinyl transferase superfamily protein [Streptomyces sp. WZ-12]
METNAALLDLAPELADHGLPGQDGTDQVPVFVVPVGPGPEGSAPPTGSGSELTAESCPGLNGHTRATLDAASRGWLLARLPSRVRTAMTAAAHWELYGTHGLLVVACGDGARQMGFSVESVRHVRRESSPLHTPYEILTPHESRTAAARPAAERERLITRYWVRKDAALQAVGSGLSLAPERIEAGFPSDTGTVAVPGPCGTEIPVRVRNFRFSAAYEFAVATPEPPCVIPSFAYSFR